MRSFLVALTAVSLVINAYSPPPSRSKGDERKDFMGQCLKGDKKF